MSLFQLLFPKRLSEITKAPEIKADSIRGLLGEEIYQTLLEASKIELRGNTPNGWFLFNPKKPDKSISLGEFLNNHISQNFFAENTDIKSSLSFSYGWSDKNSKLDTIPEAIFGTKPNIDSLPDLLKETGEKIIERAPELAKKCAELVAKLKSFNITKVEDLPGYTALVEHFKGKSTTTSYRSFTEMVNANKTKPAATNAL